MLSMEENYWNKAMVQHDITDLESLLHGKKSTVDTKLNLGLELMKKLMLPYRKEMFDQ